jgi:hypothetical protein
MPKVKQAARPTEYDAASIRHCYIDVPLDRPLTEAGLRYIWKNHTVDGEGKFLAAQDGGADYSLTFGQIADREVSPGNGLPTLTVAAISAYVRQLGYDTLTEYEEKTGAFTPPPPPPAPEPAPNEDEEPAPVE